MLPLLALLGFWQLSAPLAQWKQEIEKESHAPLVIARVYRDRQQNTITLPPDTPQRDIAKSYLMKEEFVRQLMQSYALLISHHGPAGLVNIIMLNMDRKAEWASEDAIIAHEMGHVWLKALDYPVPIIQDGPNMCLGIETGDVVQHILIRREMDRRGIDYLEGWRRDLDAALQKLEDEPAESSPTEPCRRLRLAALWLDVRLGLTDATWPNRPRLEAELRTHAAPMLPIVDQIETYLRGVDVASKPVHGEALSFVLERLKLIARGGGTEVH